MRRIRKRKDRKTRIISVELRQEQINWLVDNPNFELSDFIRHAIDEQIDMIDHDFSKENE